MERWRIAIGGIVQGVGFRPFVYGLAVRLGLAGWVRNDRGGVTIEAQGQIATLERLCRDIENEHPPLASLSRFEVEKGRPLLSESGFAIVPSLDEARQPTAASIPPDASVCGDCLRELFDPADRRRRYPFINCTNCGPRYSISLSIPYDRAGTTMAGFALCPACRAEYEDPACRRFHAQPNACPECGPSLHYLDAEGRVEGNEAALQRALERLRQGGVVAVKGIGGYHLAADARCDAALKRLRLRKGRSDKAFALMVASRKVALGIAEISPAELRLLESAERPIVLLRQKANHGLSALVAPNNRWFGLMLPYSPLHHLLLERFEVLVMTSANPGDEPILYRDEEASALLGGLADGILGHDRPIHARVDDSILRLADGRPLVLRRGRGYAPRPLPLPFEGAEVLALGAELKNAVCLARGDRAYLGPHVGDLKAEGVSRSFRGMIEHLCGLFRLEPSAVACDLHPDYLSTRYAQDSGLPVIAVQHHHAHLAGCMAENGLTGECLGVIFDGTGLGEDGSLWGGEFLLGDYGGFRRLAHLKSLPLPGGDAAVREPFRMALSCLMDAFGEELPPCESLAQLPESELGLLVQMIRRRVNSPPASSMGRLFDSAASLIGLRHRVSYEGQAALELEMCIEPGAETSSWYDFALRQEADRLIIDAAPLIRALMADVLAGGAPCELSLKFHESVARMILSVCSRLREQSGRNRVLLSGGCFQNLRLLERSSRLLREAGFELFTHCLVPPNDGGLALGQAAVASWRLRPQP